MVLSTHRCLIVLWMVMGLSGSLPGAEAVSKVHQFLQQHCASCHDASTREGNLDLTALAFDLQETTSFATWVKVHDRVRDHEMPPKDEAVLPPDDRQAFLNLLDAELLASSQQLQSREGRALARRLNRDEYQNTLRDLLGVEEDYRSRLPEDGRSLGFDKVGSALSISAEHLQAYMSVSAAALEEVIAQGPPPEDKKLRLPQRWTAEVVGSKVVKLPFGRAFGWKPDGLVRFGDFVDGIVGFRGVEQPGRYRFRIHARAWGGETVKARIRAGGPRQADVSWIVAYTEFPPEGATVVVESYLRPGDTLRVCPIGIAGPGTMHRVNFEKGHSPQNYMGPGLAMDWVEVEGPLRESWPKPGHRRLFGDLDFTTASRADAERVLRSFLPKAFRRPVSDAEVAHYVAIYEAQAGDEGFLVGIKVALQAALCSPHFLFLEAPPGRLDDFALASRLSYFLWNSLPDDELLEVAGEGRLHAPDVLHQQVERLLRDPKAAAFTASFTDQWLDLRKITATTPDGQLYPEWDELIEWSCVEETRRFFDEVLTHDLSIVNFVKSDFAVVNDRLAKHYGLEGVTGIDFQKVTLPEDSPRGGVLTQASVLKVTANGTTTSPVIRGAWVRERILGLPIPLPPQGVPAIEPDIRGATTIREQLAKHRDLTACAACHVKIDPPGFALESFDVIGGWRDRYRAVGEDARDRVPVVRHLTFDAKAFQRDPSRRGPMRAVVGLGPPVDASGELAEGEAFAGYIEFREWLASNPDQLARALVQHLIAYATSAGTQYGDRPEVEAIVARNRSNHQGFRSLIHEIIQSSLFLNQ